MRKRINQLFWIIIFTLFRFKLFGLVFIPDFLCHLLLAGTIHNFPEIKSVHSTRSFILYLLLTVLSFLNDVYGSLVMSYLTLIMSALAEIELVLAIDRLNTNIEANLIDYFMIIKKAILVLCPISYGLELYKVFEWEFIFPSILGLISFFSKALLLLYLYKLNTYYKSLDRDKIPN